MAEVRIIGKLTSHKARKAEAERDELRELLADIWLYVKWRYVTKQLTTKQKELWADAVNGASKDDADPDRGPVAERWWRDA